jgi:hypothetical protein
MVTDDRTGKELTKEEFMQWYKTEHHRKATVISLIAKLFTLGVTLIIIFIAFSALYALLRWAIGVWI